MARWLALLLIAISLGLGACGAREAHVLLPDDDNTVGVLAVRDISGSGKAIVIDKANQIIRVDRLGGKVTALISEDEVRKEFGPELDHLPKLSLRFILYFETASTRVAPDSQPELVRLFDEVASREAVEVLVTGHTDTVGYRADNDKLAVKRAEAVRKMLLDRGLKASFVWAAGRGERELLVQTPDETAEPRNRRVEVIVR